MIYFPVTCEILTPGHIKCLEFLRARGKIVVGVLTAKALEGYKECLVPFTDRFLILKTVARGISGGIAVVSQETLDPTNNIRAYNCNAIASGDGWEKKELEAIKNLKLLKIDIKFYNETTKRYSSSRIKERCRKPH